MFARHRRDNDDLLHRGQIRSLTKGLATAFGGLQA